MHDYGIPTLTKLANSNIWSNLSQIYGQTQICGQIVAYLWSKPNIWSNFICSNSNTWSNESYGHFSHIWSNMQQIYGQNSRKSPYIIVTDMTYLLVNWTDVTSTESAFANKIRDRAHKRTPTILTLCSLVHGRPPLGRSLGTWSFRSAPGLVRETRYNRTLYYCMAKQYGKHEWNY